MGCEQHQGLGTWFVPLGKTKVIPEAVIDKVHASPTPTTVAVLQEFWVFWTTGECLSCTWHKF